MAGTLLEDDVDFEQRLVVGVVSERLTGPAVAADLVAAVDDKYLVRQRQKSVVVVVVVAVAVQMAVEQAVMISPAEPQVVVVVTLLGLVV